MEAEAQKYRERLRSMTEKVAASEEQERWRLSRYIHDTIIQNLALSNIRLGSMAAPLEKAGLSEEGETLRKTRKLLDQAIDECRMVMSDLTPSLLYELGLAPALSDLAERLEAQEGIPISVEEEGASITVDNELRGLLFQSARELIVNALKHAGKCRIRVVIGRDPSGMLIRVIDNGKGFSGIAGNREGAAGRGGFGLFSIQQRLEGLGGRLTIESEPGRGTTATIGLPIREGSGAQDPEAGAPA